MSVSELFSNGSSHKWGNLTVNNLTVEGSLIGQNIPFQEDITSTYTLSGNMAGTGSYRIVKNGKITVMYLPQLLEPATDTSPIINVNLANLPEELRPSYNLSTPITTVYNNNVVTTGILQFTSAGILTINVGSANPITQGQQTGTYGRTQFSYISE